MSKPTTLFDTMYKATFDKDTIPGLDSNYALREKLVAARRFVLDDAMSTFMGDLSTRAFLFKNTKMAAAHTIKRVEALRVSAMAPHRLTWIEFNLRKAKGRVDELRGIYTPPEERPEFEAWLIEQHEGVDTAFSLHIFTWNPHGESDRLGCNTWIFPVMYGWTIDDSVPPWPSLVNHGEPRAGAEISIGIKGYLNYNVVVAQSPLLMDVHRLKSDLVNNLIMEWSGVMRMAWALLACIDDIPMVRATVTPSKSFFARGKIRKYLSHHTLVLDLPVKQRVRLASKLLGSLVKRCGHGVRQHWRKDWRRPPSENCPSLRALGMHVWTEEQVCADCSGRRIRIPEHYRGDASRGLSIADYLVRHRVDNRAIGR